jgi:hypothetical protein
MQLLNTIVNGQQVTPFVYEHPPGKKIDVSPTANSTTVS